MSDTANKLFESLRTLKDGLQQGLGTALEQAGAEIRRQGIQGSMEVAAGLFSGSGFVPYGPGQYMQTPEHQSQHQQQNDRGMER